MVIYFDKEKQANLIQQAEFIKDYGNNGKRKKARNISAGCQGSGTDSKLEMSLQHDMGSGRTNIVSVSTGGMSPLWKNSENARNAILQRQDASHRSEMNKWLYKRLDRIKYIFEMFNSICIFSLKWKESKIVLRCLVEDRTHGVFKEMRGIKHVGWHGNSGLRAEYKIFLVF